MLKQYPLPSTGGLTITNRVMALLLAELRQGSFAQADRLPSETELAARFEVSRTVIRDVLAKLEREGFIERCRGRGTIIHRDIVSLTNRLDLKYEYNDLVRGAGCLPSCDKLWVAEEEADDDVADMLRLAPHARVLRVEKRILADAKPVIYSVDYVDKSLFDPQALEAIDWARPIFDIFEEYCGITVDTDLATISASHASPAIRRLLHMKDEEAMLLIRELGCYKLSIPVLYTRAYYSNFFAFTVLRKKM